VAFPAGRAAAAPDPDPQRPALLTNEALVAGREGHRSRVARAARTGDDNPTPARRVPLDTRGAGPYDRDCCTALDPPPECDLDEGRVLRFPGPCILAKVGSASHLKRVRPQRAAP
jgi:hypothetical protein